MGCCGDDEDQSILQPLLRSHDRTCKIPTLDSSSSSSSPSAVASSSSVLSPMNSNFPALLCRDILHTILEKLPIGDLARAAFVCRLWNSVASDREIQIRAFMAPWKLKEVVGNPSSGSFWREITLAKFAISHRLVRGDSVASLAVKYSVQDLNPISSDSNIHFWILLFISWIWLKKLASGNLFTRPKFSFGDLSMKSDGLFHSMPCMPYHLLPLALLECSLLKKIIGHLSTPQGMSRTWNVTEDEAEQSNQHVFLFHAFLRLASLQSAHLLKLSLYRKVMDIKRLNNMMSDHGIFSRERLLIPVSNPDLLVDGTCYIELDAYANREVAVLYLEGAPSSKINRVVNRVTSERGKKRIVDSLRRSMQVDDETAEYYYSLSNGDPRAALMEFSQDLRWERHAGLA